MSTESFTRRETAMNAIINMDKNTFLWKLLSNTLPIFTVATQEDADYQVNLTDSDSTSIGERAYSHREELRVILPSEYISKYFSNEPESYEEKYNIRQIAMQLIMEKPVEDFIEALDNGEIPEFVRAVPGDNDYSSLYRSPNTPTLEDYCYGYRCTLRTRPLQDFMECATNLYKKDNIRFRQ